MKPWNVENIFFIINNNDDNQINNNTESIQLHSFYSEVSQTICQRPVSALYIGLTLLRTQHDMQDLFKTIYWSPRPPSLIHPPSLKSLPSLPAQDGAFFIYALFFFFCF